MSVVGTEVHTNLGMQTKTAFCIICRGSHHNPPKHLKGGTRWKGDMLLALSAHKPAGSASPGPSHGDGLPTGAPYLETLPPPTLSILRVVYTPRVPSPPSLPRKPAAPPRPQQRPDAAPDLLLALAPPFPRWLRWCFRRDRHGGGRSLLFFLRAAPGLGAAEEMASPLAPGALGGLQRQRLPS